MDTNNAKQWDSSLKEASVAPYQLPELQTWLAQPRSESAQVQYAFLIMKSGFARSGIAVKPDEIPTTWSGFHWQFYLNVDPLIRNGSRATMLQNLFSELVEFYRLTSGEFFASNLLGLMENFIDRDPPYSLTVSLLPQAALDVLPAMDEILAQRHEEYLRRMDQMSY